MFVTTSDFINACAPQKIDPALIARFRPAMFSCFWPIFFFADHRPLFGGRTALSAARSPVVSKNTNELKTGAPGRFGLALRSELSVDQGRRHLDWRPAKRGCAGGARPGRA